MYNTLNNKSGEASLALASVMLIGLLAVLFCYLLCPDMVMADTFIGESASSLLNDLKYWIVIGAVAIGVISVVKGRTAAAIIAVVVGAILFTVCQAPTLIGNIGQQIIGIFF